MYIVQSTCRCTVYTYQGAMILYTTEDFVLKDKISLSVYPPTTPNEITSQDLENLPSKILQFGADEVCLS